MSVESSKEPVVLMISIISMMRKGVFLHRKSLSSLEFCAAAAAKLVRSLCVRSGREK